MTGADPELDERLASAAFVQDPYPVYRDLREADPVHWSPRWGVWVVTRHDDGMTVLRDCGRPTHPGCGEPGIVLPAAAACAGSHW